MAAGNRDDPDDARTSRRAFLRRAGIGAAGAAVGAGAVGAGVAAARGTDAERYGFAPLPERAEPGFDHVVVLMFENRSFDHVLGRLYTDAELRPGQSFAGLQRGTHENTAPDGTVVAAHVYEGSTDVVMSQPDPDPGEFYPHVNTQWFGTVDPPGNADPGRNGYAAPYNAPADTSRPTMSGFVRDYVVNYRLERGVEPTRDEYERVMGGFSPAMLPVFSTLAKSFAVYDHWFCAVPSQTFCNRSFLHASTSHGFVTNGQPDGPAKWLDAPDVPTLFTRLEDAGKRWRVYFDADQVVSLTGFLHAPSIERYWKTNFRSMAQFHEDAANGTLPDYAFVEPRMMFDHNDMHPPVSRPKVVAEPDGATFDSAMSDVRAAEALLAEVYGAIRDARSTTGSNAVNTALVVTFDEHGGIYDHVPPPTATPPSGDPEPGEMGFGFDRLGGRVPTFVVSAYTDPGTIVNATMHHGSIAHTLCQQHGLEPLTHRDAEAEGIHNVLNRTVPRQPQLWPEVTPPYVPTNPEAAARRRRPRGAERDRPITAPAKGLLGLLLARYEPDAPVPETFGDAYDVLTKHGMGLFGDRD